MSDLQRSAQIRVRRQADRLGRRRLPDGAVPEQPAKRLRELPVNACVAMIFPALNEEARIAAGLRHALADPATADVIVVDDSSQPGIAETSASGDNVNDIELLRRVHRAFALDPDSPELLKLPGIVGVDSFFELQVLSGAVAIHPVCSVRSDGRSVLKTLQPGAIHAIVP